MSEFQDKLKESKHLIDFSKKEGFTSATNHGYGIALAGKTGAMLWTELKSLDKKLSR